jgi:hypothetical protein
MRTLIDLTGKKFGRLTVKHEAERKKNPSGCIQRYWLCECECGKIRKVQQGSLTYGTIKSCGCFSAEMARARCTTHGRYGTPLYVVWINMRNRCHNPKNHGFKNYGGRGIKVMFTCFEDFQEWALKAGYRKGLSIDRIDNDGPYSRDNCRWATQEQQVRNTRRQKRFWAISPIGRFFGGTVIVDFARRHDLAQQVIGRCLKGQFRQHKGWRFYYADGSLLAQKSG